MSEIAISFILLIAFGGGPLQEVDRYPSLADCKAAVSMSEMTATKSADQPGDWVPAKLVALCVPAGIDD